MSTQHDMGNNETVSTGIFEQRDGTFLAMTFSASKCFKTRKGAERWLARCGYAPNGERLLTSGGCDDGVDMGIVRVVDG